MILLKHHTHYRNVLIIFSLLLALTSCSSIAKDIDEFFAPAEPELAVPKELIDAKVKIKKGHYKDAENILSTYLKTPDYLYWYGHGFFMMGRALKLQKRDEEAIANYRQAIQLGKRYDRSLVAMSLYELSWLYERNQKYAEMIPALIDLSNRAPVYSRFVYEMEIPARKAAAYFALNRSKEGLANLATARQGYQKLRNRKKISFSQRKRIYVALYYMGLLALMTPEEIGYDKVLKSVKYGQENLLKVIEDEHSKMSLRSRVLLEESYTYLWNQVEAKSKVGDVEDKEGMRHQVGEEQLVMSADIFDLIQNLKGFSNPGLVASKEIKEFSRFLVKLENKILKLVNGLNLGPEITDEGRKRYKLMKTIDPNPVLEQKYLRMHKN